MMQHSSESEVVVEKPPEEMPSLLVIPLEEFEKVKKFPAPSAVQKQMVR